MNIESKVLPPGDHFSTLDVARLFGMAVRSVQLMVDRGELEAWRTPGGHRRIARESVQRWLDQRQGHGAGASAAAEAAAERPQVLLIEDSKHYQNLVSLLVRQHQPGATLTVADDGIAGLAMAGQLQPKVLIIDILLPGIDGATLIMSLRSHPQFANMRLIVITSLDEADRAPYRFALEGVPLVPKARLVTDLPPLLDALLATEPAPATA